MMKESNNDKRSEEELVLYIKQLEISLAKKDQLIAEKDKRINILEEEVAIHPVFRNNKHLASLSTPSNSSLGSKLSSHSSNSKRSITSPHPISDESGESEQTLSHSTSLGLSYISKVNSSDTNEIVDNGRWNIPWDEEEDTKGNRRISNGNALRDIEFVSIEKEHRVRRDSSVGTTVLARPVPRRQTLGSSPTMKSKGEKNKENVFPKKRESTSFGEIR